MRPLRPGCGTVSSAQLLTLPATISTSAPGVVTTQFSFLPPASSSATDVCASSESRPATAQPPEPPPTTTKSNISIPRSPVSVIACPGGFFGDIARSGGENPEKIGGGPFQSRRALIHSPRTQGLRPGSPSQEASVTDRSAPFGVDLA